MELVVNGAAVWKCSENHYVGLVPCVIVAITEKRVKVAIMLSNGKLGMRYVGKRDLVPVECHKEEAIVLNIRCELKLKEQKQ